MVVVAYRRWLFTRGSNSYCYCKALTGKVLVFCIGGRLWEVVAYKDGHTWRFNCISIKKTAIIGQDMCALPSISINSLVLEVTDNFTLLGSTITSK